MANNLTKRFFFLMTSAYKVKRKFLICILVLFKVLSVVTGMVEIQNIFIDGSAKTPHVDFNQHSGDLILSGKSIPENAAKMYEPLLRWVNDYVGSPRQTTNLRLSLEYFNSSTAIWLAKIVRSLSRIAVKDYVLLIHLYFEIEEYDEMNMDELKDIIGMLVDNIPDAKVSIGLKTYGVDENGKTIRESTILI